MRFFSSLLLSVASFTALSSAAPLEETSSNLSRRGADFSTYGDWTGSTSSYPDGSGQYVRSDDDHHYASRVHCWTDLVCTHSLQSIIKLQATNLINSSTSTTPTKPTPGNDPTPPSTVRPHRPAPVAKSTPHNNA